MTKIVTLWRIFNIQPLWNRRNEVTSQKARVNAVIAREPKRPRQSPNQIAASPPAPRNDVSIYKMYWMHGVIETEMSRHLFEYFRVIRVWRVICILFTIPSCLAAGCQLFIEEKRWNSNRICPGSNIVTGYILFPIYTLYAFIAVCAMGLILGVWNTFTAGDPGA